MGDEEELEEEIDFHNNGEVEEGVSGEEDMEEEGEYEGEYSEDSHQH